MLLFLSAAQVLAATDVKKADLAGSWYPDSKTELESQLRSYMESANPENIEGDIISIIVPHAGYIYSGPVAAYGFKAIQEKGFKTVVLIGFSHRKHFDGIAIYDRGRWSTPVGDIEIDEDLARAIASKYPRIIFNPEIFREENSVEMEVPFIKMFLKDAKMVPIAFGTQEYEDALGLSAALSSVLKDRSDVVIVASTDLSHYKPYDRANRIDRHTIDTLGSLKAKTFYEEGKLGLCELCGLLPVTASLLVAEKLGYNRIKELKYANSGDITGDKGRVVGYLSAVIYKEGSSGISKGAGEQKQEAKMEENRMLNDAQRQKLLKIARESITSFVRDGKRKDFTEKDPVLNQDMGAFVTLHKKGELRGCIGNIVGSGPLYNTVAQMAVEAATGDPRFQSLSPAEIDKIDIEISVLSPLKKVKGADEITIPGHGVIVKKGFRSGVYLPQVADETGWNKEEFLTSLCTHKAGLPPDAWKDPGTEIYIYTAEVFGEGGNKDAK